MKMLKKCKGGFSLVEILVSLGVLAVIAVGVMQGVSYFTKETNKVETEVKTEEFVTSLAETILEGAKLYQIDYSSRSAIEILQNSPLPMAWDDNGVNAPVDECAECKGRYGVVLKPITNHKGLYSATIRIVHPNLTGGEVIIRQLVGI